VAPTTLEYSTLAHPPPVTIPRIAPIHTLPPTIASPLDAPAVVAPPAAPATFAFASLNIMEPGKIAPIKPIVFNNMYPSQQCNSADPRMIEIENINKIMKETNEIAFKSRPTVDYTQGDYTSGMILKTYAPDVDPNYCT